ncbi:hypothetical protein [Mycobacterium intracellulare]|uniref:hypothetical protein n=1 Tax=Mycobacterium intracellulare TaxID=1767 RepID=UPI00114FE397|nr:hypothetical protein [Mycobacterium intracellulare]
MDAEIGWTTGVAAVIGATKQHVAVECLFCGGVHRHERRWVGSEAVAGCHAGHGCRQTYVIPLRGVR